MKAYDSVLSMLISSGEATFKHKLARFCDKIGMMQFRVVRQLFSIDQNKIQSIAEKVFANNNNPAKTEFNSLCQKWKVSYLIRYEGGNTRPVADRILNNRSVQMEANLQGFEEYDSENKQLQIGRTTYQVITADVHEFNDYDKPLVSCGSTSSREFVMLNQRFSPHLHSCYHEFEELVQSKHSEKGSQLSVEEVLPLLIKHVDGVFSNRGVKPVEELVEKEKNMVGTAKIGEAPCISMNTFIDNKCGVCRHHSLLAAYLLDRFMKEHQDVCAFNGKVQIMRNEVKGGAHAWLTLACNDKQVYTIDTQNKFYANMGDISKMNVLANKFGEAAVQNQMIKAAKLLETV